MDDKILHKELSYKIVGCFYEIRNEYGPGHKEKVYGNLLAECFDEMKIPYEREKPIKIYSKRTGNVVGLYKPDFLVDDKIIIEMKSSIFTTRTDERQFYHYLRNSKYELAYLVNFSTPRLYINRIVYSNYRKPFLNKSQIRVDSFSDSRLSA